MMGLIIDWNWDVIGTVGAIVAPIITLLIIVFYAGGLKEKITNNTGNITKLDEKLDDHIEKSDKRHYEMKEQLGRIDGSLDIIKRGIGVEMKTLTRNNSPVVITDEGWEVVKAINAKEAIDEVWDKILEEISKKVNKESNPYDINEACFDVADRYMSFITKQRQESTKLYALKKSYKLYDFDRLFGVIIRDRYFKENGIDIT